MVAMAVKETSPKPEALAKQIRAREGSASPEPDAPRGKTPPFDWPDKCGTFDIRIDRAGVWYYHGSPINRIALVKLFATVLRRDQDGAYWLVTPVEAGRIEVEDVPFTAVEVTAFGDGRAQVLTMRTNLDDNVTVDGAHPIRVEEDPESGQPAPYVTVRDGLEARILRPVFYHLVELGEESPSDLSSAARGQIYGIWSSGRFFALGSLEAKD